jgi:hypothetical protein
VARAVDGLFLGEDSEVVTVATDSRLVEPGALFVALPGTRTDGGEKGSAPIIEGQPPSAGTRSAERRDGQEEWVWFALRPLFAFATSGAVGPAPAVPRRTP